MKLNEIDNSDHDKFFNKLRGENISIEKIEDIITSTIIDKKLSTTVADKGLNDIFVAIKKRIHKYALSLEPKSHEISMYSGIKYGVILHFLDYDIGIIAGVYSKEASTYFKKLDGGIFIVIEDSDTSNLDIPFPISYDILIDDYTINVIKKVRSMPDQVIFTHRAII